MLYEGREEVLAALRELEAMKEGRHATTGEFFAHIDFQMTITYMGKVPVDFGAECYVSTDRVEDLQPAVREAYKRLADHEEVFEALDKECHRTEEREDHGETFYSEEEDFEQDLN